MTYTAKTIENITRKLKRRVKYFLSLPFDQMTIHISDGNAKIGKVHNFSLAPILTCSNCKVCKYACYDVKACLQYENVRIARAENTAMVTKDLQGTFERIADYISHRRAHFFFRFHVSGEIINIDYFEQMVRLAKRFPEWRFWTYTKNYPVVNKWMDDNGKLPENLSVMFSSWEGVPMYNPHNLPTFTCIKNEKNAPAGIWRCPGNCDTCKAARRGCIYGESAWTTEH